MAQTTIQATTLNAGELLRVSWSQWKANALTLTGVALVLFAVNIIFNIIVGDASNHSSGFVITLGNIIGFIGNTILSLFMYIFFLQIARGEKIRWNALLQWNRVLPLLLLNIVLGLLIVAGYILLFIPGVYLTLLFLFAPYLLVDQKLSPYDAAMKSVELTRGKKLTLLWILIVSILVTLLGFLVFLVGALVSIPVSMLILVNAYLVVSDSYTTPKNAAENLSIEVGA